MEAHSIAALSFQVTIAVGGNQGADVAPKSGAVVGCLSVDGPVSSSLVQADWSQRTLVDEGMSAIVLVGGQGSRLRGVVSDRPKPMADVAGRPFLEWLLMALEAQGVRDVTLATGYMAEMVRAHFGDGRPWGLHLHYVHEDKPLGTGGAARHAVQTNGPDRILVLNGDSLCMFDVGRLLNVHERYAARATLWLVPMADCRRYGTVDVAEDGYVIGFHEKSPATRAGLISAGVYLLDREVLEEIPRDHPTSLEEHVFPALIGRGLYATVGGGPFLDIGTPESYASAGTFIAGLTSSWRAAL